MHVGKMNHSVLPISLFKKYQCDYYMAYHLAVYIISYDNHSVKILF